MQDKERFRAVKGDYALIWPNPENGAYDEKVVGIAPEYARFFVEKYGKSVKIAQRLTEARHARSKEQLRQVELVEE
jgi:hypothetical protein